MSDDYAGDDVTETNRARLQRESIKRQRGEMPTAPEGSVAEAFGYAASEVPDITSDAVSRDEEWHEERRKGIGGGDIAAIMGWGFSGSSQYKVWAEKVGLIGHGDDGDNERFKFGHRMEPVLAEWFHEETGLYVGSMQDRRTHPSIPFARCTIDGEVMESRNSTEPLGGWEAKTAGVGGWKADDPIPVMYQAQGQWSMLVCGWERIWFAVLHGHAFRVYELEADEADQSLLLERARAFWNDHVLTLDPPPIDDSPATTRTLRSAYPGNEDGQTAWLPEYAETLALLRVATREEGKWKRTVALHKNTLKEAMGNATEADFGNGPEVKWSRFEQTRVDAKALKTLYPDAYKACTRKTGSERFTVAGEREDDDG